MDHFTERERLAMRAKGTAFEVLYEPKRCPPPPRELTPQERYKQKNRDAAKARYHAKKAAARNLGTGPGPKLHSLSNKSRDREQKVLRDNVGHSFCPAISGKADADKTARIRGRV